ncbi:hypothetical protein H4C81_28930 [Pseudomonas monteilii]|uniref:hypothetical protein n=1 Tax=Pseudomonas monteilii TaxID=76759 RepID=UPI0015F9CA21|nr:hypothetical protein [Pseudomonas monteilii]MBA6092840.1 hypothetical protein [Pseudomonas monteilii]
MQRNKELALELLATIVSEDHGGGGLYREEIQAVLDEKYPDHEEGRRDAVDYHLHLLETAGFLKFTQNGKDDDNYEVTWAGHDYLEKNAPLDFIGDFVVG